MATNLNDLATFVRVAELGTFAAVAKAEGLPKSTISRRVARLEDELGVALLRRSSRSFSLTEDGQSLHARAAGALRELEGVTDALGEQKGPSGRLVVTVPVDLATAPVVVDLFAAYRTRYPEVELEVRLLDRFVDLVAESVDVALRVHASAMVPADNALMARGLGTIRAAFFAAPSYLEAHGVPEQIDALTEADVIAHRTFLERPVSLVHEDGQEVLCDLSGATFSGNSMYLIGAMVERGAGIGPLPRFAAEEAVKEKRLVRVLPAWWLRASRLTLVWPSSRHLAPRVRAMVDMATERLHVAHWMCDE